jgi:hypothetical protein
MLYFVKKMDKSNVNDISKLPLENDDEYSETINHNNLKQA